jgi:hypothetical protein
MYTVELLCSDALDEDLDVLHELQNLKLYRSYIHRYRFQILILCYNLAIGQSNNVKFELYSTKKDCRKIFLKHFKAFLRKKYGTYGINDELNEKVYLTKIIPIFTSRNSNPEKLFRIRKWRKRLTREKGR